MKKQNKTYLPLKKLGIYKAFDKCIVYSINNDPKYYNIVLFYANKPFSYWSIIKDEFDALTLDNAISCCIKYYNGLDLNARRNSKRITKYFLDRFAGNVVKVFFGFAPCWRVKKNEIQID